jgi:ribonuclease P protein component
MLPYKNRLKKRTDFERVYKYGKFFYFGDIAVKFVENGLNESRMGFSVGVNFSKKAIERNRAKRQLREACRTLLERIVMGRDIVFILTKKKNKLFDWKKLGLFLEKALKKEKLIKSNKQ